MVQLANLGLTIYLVGVHKMGAIGAALSSLVMVAVAVPFLYLPEACRLTGLKKRDWIRQTIWPGYQPAVAAALALILSKVVFRPQSWLALGLCSAIGGVVYTLYLLGFCLDQYEKRDVGLVMNRILKRVWVRRS
jgi:peptidoglycan biosynthesis protein MviN/MurJ (putative lipid II flippase)